MAKIDEVRKIGKKVSAVGLKCAAGFWHFRIIRKSLVYDVILPAKEARSLSRRGMLADKVMEEMNVQP